MLGQMYAEDLERLNRLCVTNIEGGVPLYMNQIEGVRDIFAGNTIYTPPPQDSMTHRASSEENPQSEDMRVDTPQNEEMRVGTVVCYHCRENIAGIPIKIQIYGHTLQICSNCDDPITEQHIPLQEHLKNLVPTMRTLERERWRAVLNRANS